MRLSDVAFTVQATLLPPGAFAAFHMNKFGRSNNDGEYDSDASSSESDDAVPTSGDIDNDAPDGQQPGDIAASADEIARRITGWASSNWGS